MKKTFFAIAVIILFPTFVMAQVADVTAVEYSRTNTVAVSVSWVADGAGAVSVTIDETSTEADLTQRLYGTFCVNAETAPGIPIPTAGYDVTITDALGYDVFAGGLMDRSATDTEVVAPAISAGTGYVYGGFPIRNTWTVSITNAGAGGSGILEIVFR